MTDKRSAHIKANAADDQLNPPRTKIKSNPLKTAN